MHTMRDALRAALLFAMAAAPVAGVTAAPMVALTFSGMYELDLVLDYYNGGLSQSGSRGPTLGITFSPSATVGGDIFVGGHFSTANEPSPPVTMAFNATRGGSTAAVMNVPAGFSGGFSTYYSSPATSGTVTVYSGPDATGSVLGTLTLAQTPVDQTSVDPISHFVNTYSTWKPVGVQFSGVAHSVDFRGATDVNSSVHGAAFDNITLGSGTPRISSALNDAAIVFDASTTSRDSTHAALSQDGSVEVFQSQQTDLTPNTSNTGGQDIYSVGANRVPVLENIDSSGNKLVGTASLPAVSPDGNAIAFLFTPAAKDKKDFVAGQMWAGARGQPKHQVDVGMGGGIANGSAASAPSLASGDGVHLLAFCSGASNLVSNDTNVGRDIFLVDPLNAASAAQRISLDGAGKELPGDSCEPKFSSDGAKLVFSVASPTLFGTGARQIVLKDLGGKALITGQFLPITTNSGGQGASADSSEPAISADGGVIAFTSSADLDGLGAPVGGREVFVSLRQPGGRLIKRARSADGAVPDGASQHPQLSDDGAALVMQTAATNYLGSKSLGKEAGGAVAVQCGTVAITTNLFNPASLGSSLCASGNRSNTNQNPAISGDGKKVALDSNAPQSGTSSSNSNPYVQNTVADGANAVAGLSGDYSGQWYDPNQSGQGLVIDELQPDGSNARAVLMTWFVFSNGQPTWLQGAGILKSGRGAAAGSAVVQMDQVAIYHAKSFPIGQDNAVPALWGSVTLTFASANEGTMYWTSSYPGFGNGSQQIKHFLSVGIPAPGASSGAFGACYSGNWKEPSKSGHGFEFEVLPTSPPVLAADWFTFAPNGAPVWLYGAGQVSGGSVQMQLVLINGSGAQFPPRFDSSRITQNLWGTATVTFSDNAHAHLSWSSVISGYGSGQIDLQPTFGAGFLARRGCQ